MTEVYLVRGNCGDYYCGCGGGHVLAVADTPSRATHYAEQAATRHRVYRGSTLTGDVFTVSVTGPFPLNALLEEEFSV